MAITFKSTEKAVAKKELKKKLKAKEETSVMETLLEDLDDYEDDYEGSDDLVNDQVIPSNDQVTKERRNLRDSIDYNRLFAMIYSGVENKKYFDILYNLGIRDFLISYHYIHDKKLDMEYYKSLGIKFFIDSGAYTYQGQEKYYSKPKEFWEKQIVEYLDWARANKDVIFAIANLDLENLFDFETTKEWNKKYFEPFMIETGIPVCFIWHPCDGDEGWEYYTKRYPYTGFSWVADSGQDLDFNFGKRMLDIARKNNSVCHGMGMTRTSLLTKLPFYTSDSTTWLVGLQYGEVNYWTGKKMSRLKKDKWKGEKLPELVKLGCDREKLLAEDPEEMIKANIIAFQQAQEFIDTKLRPRMYWLNPVAEKRDINSPEIFDLFPEPQWLAGETDFESYEVYAQRLNINPELSKDEIIHLLTDMTLVCCHKEDDTTEILIDNLESMHEEYINTVVGSDEERLEDLEKFFWGVVEGTNNTLLMKGVREVAKERDHYIEEEEFEEIDVPTSEYYDAIDNAGLKLLPHDASAPEIDEMDKEIFDMTGYLAVRDEKGRFLKGVKVNRKKKNVYSDKYPKLSCSTCYAAQTCPEYKEGYVCAYNKMFKRFDCRNASDVIEAMQGMVNMNMERMQRVAIFEMLDGGMPDGTLTAMIDQNMRLMMNMKAVMESQAVVKQVRTIQADGTVQETTQVNSNGGSGVMEALMKSLIKKDEDPNKEELDINDVIDVNPEDIKEIK